MVYLILLDGANETAKATKAAKDTYDMMDDSKSGSDGRFAN
jgi:hypothetical protein